MLETQSYAPGFLERSQSYQTQYLSKLNELSQFSNPDLEQEPKPGIISSDSSSIMGKDGWIYIYSGSNKFLDQFRGSLQLDKEQANQWKEILQSRADWHQARNIKYLHLFVPSKLAVYPEFFPEKIIAQGERPIIQLQEICKSLFEYPLEILVRNKKNYRLYEKQNSHWSFWGCFFVYEMLCNKLGIEPNYQLLDYPIEIINEKADLGAKFQMRETRLHKRIKFKSDIVYDNELINYCNRGSIRIIKNNQTNLGKMVIFGDSFSNPGYPEYNQRKRHIHRLSSMFAETVSEVHFVWSPWIDYDYIEQEKPDFVLTEMAERFLIKVPQDENQPSIQEYANSKLAQYKKMENTQFFTKQMNNAKENFKLGNTLREQEQIDESIAAYEKALSIKPDYVRPLYSLGEIYKGQENWLEAAKCYRRIIGLNPSNPNAYIKLARVLKRQNKIYGAIAAYAEAIELKPDLGAGVYRDYGDLLLQVNDKNPEAIAAYQKAAEIKSDWGAGFYNKFANLLDKQGKLEESTTYYLKALSLQGDNPAQYLLVGNIYLKQGLLKEAAGNYQRAIEIKPDFSNVYKKMGDLLKQKNQLDDAVKCYQKALQLQPDFKGVYRALGNLLMEQGKQSEAQQCYQLAS